MSDIHTGPGPYTPGAGVSALVGAVLSTAAEYSQLGG